MSERGRIRALPTIDEGRGQRITSFQSGVHPIDAGPGAVTGAASATALTVGMAAGPRFLRVFRFADFVADERQFQLRRLAEPVAVQPKVLELIFYLLRHRDRVVTKAELFESLWSGVVVTGASLLYAVKEARKVLGDDAQAPRFVSNVRGRGYRFIASVEEGTGPLLRRKALASREPHEQTAAPMRFGVPLVGREEVMARLRVHFAQAMQDQAVALMLSGDPGIGKTRIAEEVAAYVRAQGAGVLFGRCSEVEGAPPFWPWVQVIRAYLAQHDLKHAKRAMAAGASDIAAIVPELRELWSDFAVSAPIESVQARFRVFDAIATFLRNAAERQPLAIVIDDVQCADAPSLLLLQYLVSQLANERVLLLCVGRRAAVAQNETLVQISNEIARRDPGRHLELQGLTAAEIGRLVFETTGKSASELMIGRLSELTAGNPLFLTQVLHVLSAEGRLAQLETVTLGSGKLPVGVTEGLSHYLDFLAEPVRRVLAIAAVFGREFSAAPIAAVSGLGYELVLECLGEAVRWRVLGEAVEIEGPYRFAHVLMRDVLYTRLNPAERVRLHREAAEALLTHYDGAVEPPVAQLAHHFLEAAGPGDSTRAMTFALVAAHSAVERAAYEEACALCVRALHVAAAHGADPAQRAALTELHADTQARLQG